MLDLPIKRHVAFLTIILAALLCIGTTFAFLQARDETPIANTFAFGNVKTQIVEDLSDGNKIVQVKNVGSVSAYVRVRFAVSGVKPEQVKIVSNLGAATDPDSVYLVLDASALSSWSKNGDNFSYSADDFYYYLGKLAPGNTTAPLLSKVVAGSNVKIDPQNFSVSVYQEATVATGDQSLSTAAQIAAQFNN